MRFQRGNTRKQGLSRNSPATHSCMKRSCRHAGLAFAGAEYDLDRADCLR